MSEGVRGPRPRTVVLLLAAVACALLLASPAAALAAGTIQGTVADEFGTPIPNADVAVFTVDAFAGYATAEVATTVAQPDGTFSVEVPAGSYLIGARDGDVYPAYQYFLPRRGGNAMNPLTAVANTGLVPVADGATVANIDIRMQPSLFIQGRIVRSIDGQPLGGIIVSSLVNEFPEGWHVVEETVSRPDGTYCLQTPSDVALAVPDGVFAKVSFRDPAGVYARQVYDGQVDFDAGADFELVAGTVTSGIDATLTVGGSIAGKVTDAVTGAPLPLVSVEVFRLVPLAGVYEPMNLDRLPVLTAADGTYRWGGLPPGTYKVKFAGEPVQWGPEFYGGIHVTDGNVIPAEATAVVVGEGEDVTGVDGHLDLFDGAAPVTTSNITAAWRAPGFVVSLTATDPVYPGTGVSSGVARTEYRIGAGPLLTGTSFAVNATQTVAVSFRSVDNYGNAETTKTATLKIDSEPPVTVSNAVPSYLDTAPVSFSATDTKSGVASTRYRVDGGPVRTGTSVTVYGPGSHTVQYWSVDAVGNTEAVKSATFDIVRTPVEWDAFDQGNGGTTRSIQVSKSMYGPGSAPRAVVVANSSTWADALSGAALAGAVDAPLLLIDPANPAPVVDEAARLHGLGATRVFVLGGATSVPENVRALFATPFGSGNVIRLGGRDRFAVSRSVVSRTVSELQASGGFDGTVLVVSGSAPFDAVAASPVAVANGWPVVLAQPTAAGGMSTTMRSHLTAIGADRAIVIGGTNSVSPAMYRQLSAKLQGAIRRITGADRYALAAAVGTWAVAETDMTWDGAGFASGAVFNDGVSGAVLLGGRGSVLLLTAPTSAPGPTRTALTANRSRIFHVSFFGNSAVMPSHVRAAVLGLL